MSIPTKAEYERLYLENAILREICGMAPASLVGQCGDLEEPAACGDAVFRSETPFTLTPDEREAVLFAVAVHRDIPRLQESLRGLLERTAI